MKTQLSNISEILSGLNGLSWGTIGHYFLLLAKQGIKEALGSEVELELLLILVAGYFISAKNTIVNSTLINRIKSFQPFNRLYLKNGLKLIS